jgi:hypothetical protein
LAYDGPFKHKIIYAVSKEGCNLNKRKSSQEELARQEKKTCEFCYKLACIRHLFFECHSGKFLWLVTYILLGLKPPANFEDLFNSWSKQGGLKQNLPLQIVVAAI